MKLSDISGPQSAPMKLSQIGQQETQSAPQGDVLSSIIDGLRSVPGGIAKGTSAIAGFPADLFHAGGWLAHKADSLINGPTEADQKYARFNAFVNNNLPTTENISNAVAKPFGGYYEPKTTTGDYAQTVASFAPAAASPGSLASRVLRVAVPGAASEAGGQLTKGTSAEPYARAAGALLGGGATMAAEAGASKVKSALTPKPSVLTVPQLKAAGGAAYTAADQAGIIISKNSVKNLATTVRNDMANEGVDKTLHPNAVAVVNRVSDLAKNHVTLKGLETVRRVANDALDGATKSDKRLIYRMIDHIDDYVDQLGPKDVLGGANPQATTTALTTARNLWSRAAKGATIQKLIDKARLNSKSMVGNFPTLGYGNALRTEFRKLANNERGMSRFSPDEREAIRSVATGDATENVLRLIGKLSPDQVIPALSEGASYAVGGPHMLAVPLAGAAAKLGATAMTARKARLASEMMRRGGPAPRPPSPQPQSLVMNPFMQGLLALNAPRLGVP